MDNVAYKNDGFTPGKLYAVEDNLIEFFSVLQPSESESHERKETVHISAFGYPSGTVLMYVNQKEKAYGPFLDPHGRIVMLATWNNLNQKSLVLVSEESSV